MTGPERPLRVPMNSSLVRRRTFIVVACLTVGLAAACKSTEYGGKPVKVVLTTKEQERERLGPVPASASLQSLAANAYLATLDQWMDLKGRERMAEIERFALEGNERAHADAVKELLIALAPCKCPTPTPAEVLVFPRTHVFVASKANQVRSLEFQPHQLDPDDRKAIVSFETVE